MLFGQRSQYCLLLLCAIPTAYLSPLSGVVLNSSQTYQNETSADTTTAGRCRKRDLDLRTIFYTILLVCVFIIGIFGNVMAFVVILLSRSLRCPTSFIIASLNLCDIGVILCSIPLRLDGFLYGKFCFDIHVCRFFNITDLLFHISSISHLFVIAIERYIGAHYPFFHRCSVDTKLIVKVIVLTWCYSVLWTVSGLFDWENLTQPSTLVLDIGDRRVCVLNNKIYYIVVYVVTYIIPLFVMAVLYSLILRKVLRLKTRMLKRSSILQESQQQQQQQKQIPDNQEEQKQQHWHVEQLFVENNKDEILCQYIQQQHLDQQIEEIQLPQRQLRIGQSFEDKINETTCSQHPHQHQHQHQQEQWRREYSPECKKDETSSNQHAQPQRRPQRRKQKVQHSKNEQNMSKTVAIIYGAFVICWLPVALISIINQTCPKILIAFMVRHPTFSDAIFTTFIVVLPAIHSCLNPFIYIIFHERFRTAFRALIGARGRNHSQSVTSDTVGKVSITSVTTNETCI